MREEGGGSILNSRMATEALAITGAEHSSVDDEGRVPSFVWNKMGVGSDPPATASTSLLPPRKDELRRFRTSLLWLGLDQSSALNLAISYMLFVILAILVPFLSTSAVDGADCGSSGCHPFEKLVRVVEFFTALIAFVCITHNIRSYGLRRFLFLDQIEEETPEVQNGYRHELQKAFRLLAMILLPAFIVELVYQVLWYTYATVSVPFIHNKAVKNTLMCTAVMISWVYKMSVFLLPCILFRLMCYLQNLRFEGYIKMLEITPDVQVLLKEHMRLRQQLSTISHRYRMFIVLSLLIITACQFSSLLRVTADSGNVNFFAAGDLAVCSAVQLIGILVCLHGAARITHRAQGIVSIVSEWHAILTAESNANTILENNNGSEISASPRKVLINPPRLLKVDSDSDMESAIHICAYSRDEIRNGYGCYRERQSLVSYLQNNSSGITIFGLVLDRAQLQLIFMIEMSLVLWILGKTIGAK